MENDEIIRNLIAKIIFEEADVVKNQFPTEFENFQEAINLADRSKLVALNVDEAFRQGLIQTTQYLKDNKHD